MSGHRMLHPHVFTIMVVTMMPILFQSVLEEAVKITDFLLNLTLEYMSLTNSE